MALVEQIELGYFGDRHGPAAEGRTVAASEASGLCP